MSACEPIDGKCFLEKRFRWKLCLIADVWTLCVSATLRKPSTHCCRTWTFGARIFNVSPDEHAITNVRVSSLLDWITAPAKCSWSNDRFFVVNFNILGEIENWADGWASTRLYAYLPSWRCSDIICRWCIAKYTACWAIKIDRAIAAATGRWCVHIIRR